MASSRDSRESEFGGVPGRIAPLPHELTSEERTRLERATDPMNPSDTAEAALVREWTAEGRI